MRASASQRRPTSAGEYSSGEHGSGQPDREAQPGLAEISGVPGLPGPQEPAAEPAAAEVLAALCASAQRLLSAAEHPPARLKLAAAGASVELEWPPPGGVTPAGQVPAAGPVPAASAAPPAVTAAAATAPALVPGPAVTAVPAGAGATAGAAPSTQAVDLCIRAPMVGTFYHAPEPGSAPFVRPGDVVEAGQQVGILEVMKLMTPVESDRRARVVEFLVPDAAAVEHGQPLISCATA